MSIKKLSEIKSELGRTLTISRYESNDSGHKRTEWILKVDDDADRAMSYTASMSDIVEIITTLMGELDYGTTMTVGEFLVQKNPDPGTEQPSG